MCLTKGKDCFKKQDPTKCYLQGMHFKYKDTQSIETV